LPWHTIWKIKKEEKITKYVKKIPSIIYSADSNTTMSMFKQHSHDKIVVVNEKKDILGVIYAHDALKLIVEADSFRRAAGVKKEEDVYDNLFQKTKNRYKWLILNLGTAFLAASIVGLFENTIATLTLLAIYMPVIAGMGGNAGTQTLAVFIRGIALKEIELNKKAMRAIGNEIGAGAINGLITGLMATAIALFFNKSPILGLIVGVAMIFNLMVAGFFGAIIPLIMSKIGKDPATSATIFITTATDVFGFFVFLGMATMML
jgi:magnesium transporter